MATGWKPSAILPASKKPDSPASHQTGTGFRQFGALATGERDVGHEGLAFETVAGVDQSVAAAVHIRMVDLGWVADHHQLGVARHPRDDGLGFLWGDLLGLVENEKPIGDGASAD